MGRLGVLHGKERAQLAVDLRTIIEQGRQQAQAAATQVLVQTYWKVGQRIVKANLTDRAHYGESILQELAEALKIDVRTLQHSVLFFKTYKTSPRARNLSWAHYRVLIGLPKAAQRTWYADQIESQGWSRDQLREAIRQQRFEESTQVDGQKKSSETTILNRPTTATYVYKAEVERVVDGDTLLLRVDLGFAVFKEQRVRLAGLDTPPLDMPAGRQAYEALRDMLARVPFVMVKTHQIDIYGRYLGHIFCSLEPLSKERIFQEGMYLNQWILDQGLAKAM